MVSYILHTVRIVGFDIFSHGCAVPSFPAAIHGLYIVTEGMANSAYN